jgi:hypothetical protein
MLQEEDMAFENRNYLILSTSEINLINFDEVLETSVDTLRLSTDGSKTFIKWEETVPSFVESITTKEGPYTHLEILEILSTEEWSGNTEYGTSA